MGYYETPSYFDYKLVNVKTTLSARALSSMTSQALGLVSASVTKHRRRLYILSELKKDTVKNAKGIERLENIILKKLPQKPVTDTTGSAVFKAELSSKCAKLIPFKDGGEFDFFLKLSALGPSFGTILVPIKQHRHSKQLNQKGKLMTSFLVGNKSVDLRWEMKVQPQKKSGKILGGDSGLKTVLTFSDGQSTDSVKDIHGHTLNSILQTMARSKKGSKAFRRHEKHRTNFINWSIKQLNFKGVKQLNQEKVVNIFYKNKTSRFLSHWTNSEIEKALASICELNGVRLVYQNSTYRSQRCSGCGLVRKANRVGKLYKCKSCGLKIDADLNGAKNHALTLPSVPVALRRLKLNRKGFFWSPKGLFNVDGSELRVPNTSKETELA